MRAGDYGYISARPSARVREWVGIVVRNLAPLCKVLGLGEVHIGYLEHDESVARYIAGSTTSPIIFIDPKAHEREARKDLCFEASLESGLESSLVHELGHAYLEARGLDTYHHDEEIVEAFAVCYCDFKDAVMAKRLLRRAL